jgi:hypothetical protein
LVITKDFESHSQSWGNLTWQEWTALDASRSAFNANVVTDAGLYRIRSPKCNGLVYIGQTGRNLRERARSLARGVYRDSDDVPWNDPHTAAPILWAYRHEDGFEFEVSIAAIELETPVRQCHEDYLLYLHRVECGHSTLANHGRLHPFWSRATNKGRGRAAQRREEPVSYPSLCPAIGNGDIDSSTWLGIEWTEFQKLNDKQAPDAAGAYRIHRDGDVLYFGESQSLKSRIRTHANDARFRGADVSFHVLPEAAPHQLKERETDLIGAYFGSTGLCPKHQYGAGCVE